MSVKAKATKADDHKSRRPRKQTNMKADGHKSRQTRKQTNTKADGHKSIWPQKWLPTDYNAADFIKTLNFVDVEIQICLFCIYCF